MTSDEKKKCHRVIHSATIAAGGAGMIPLPVADNVVIAPIQTAMIVALGKIFGHTISQGYAKSIVGTLFAGQLGTALVKMIPGGGIIIKAGVAASLTETLGWTIAKEFAEGKDENSLNLNTLIIEVIKSVKG